VNRHRFEVIDPYDDIPCICSNCRLEASGHDLPDTECPVVPVTMESLKAQVVARDALLDRVVTEVGRTITPELRADIDKALALTQANAPVLEPRIYNDHSLEDLKRLAKMIEYADGLQISGPSGKCIALLTCATSVPYLVARIEELEGAL
jgi:hypothetical protein